MTNFRWIAAALLLSAPLRATAGLYYSKEVTAELPARWRGFLLDHRALRSAGIAPTAKQPASFLRERYETAAADLEAAAKRRELTADESADLGALLLRLNRTDDALAVLRRAAGRYPKHFALAANLGTAWQLAGDLRQADRQLGEAAALAPAAARPFEEAHRKLVQGRIRKSRQFDDLFGIPFTGSDGKPRAGGIAPEQRKTLPGGDVATVQQLALWLPADGFLVWQLAELANAHGDVRTASSLLEGAVGEYGIGVGDIRERRRLYKEAADEIAKKADSEHERYRGDVKFASNRPLVRRFDPSQLPAIQPKGVNPLSWAQLADTAVDKPFKLRPTPYLDKLDGLRVTITGYQFSASEEIELESFLLVEYPVGCWFCESPEPNGLLQVELAGGKKASRQRGPIRVSGTLKLNRDDPEDYLFRLADASVEVVD